LRNDTTRRTTRAVTSVTTNAEMSYFIAIRVEGMIVRVRPGFRTRARGREAAANRGRRREVLRVAASAGRLERFQMLQVVVAQLGEQCEVVASLQESTRQDDFLFQNPVGADHHSDQL
jgi:hypothetical protein